MADTAISALTALGGAPATDDLLVLVDVSDHTQAPTGTTKSMTVTNVFTSPSMTGPTVASGGLTITLGGLTVSAGTTAVQALTATTFTVGVGGITSGGGIAAGTDATFDIGAAASARFRDLYMSRNGTFGGALSVSDGVLKAELASDASSPRIQSYSSKTLYINELGNPTVIGASGTLSNVSIFGTLGVSGAITASGGVVGAVTGNASTATALQTARTIGGVSFDGTANITVASATGGFTVSGGTLTAAATAFSGDLAIATNKFTVAAASGNTSIAGTLAVTGAITASGGVTGNASTATALQTARTIGGVSFNGTANITVASATGGFAVSGGNLTAGIGIFSTTLSVATGASFTHNTGATAGFFGATPTSQPTISGSKGGNAALASLLTGLATLGLILDATT